jgi:hypothetical protein
MLNGIDPIIIFQIYKQNAFSAQQNKILQSIIPPNSDTRIPFPPIPIYLSEKLTGLYIESEDKSIQITTENQTFLTGDQHKEYQKGANSTLKVNLIANKDSLGLTLLSVLADLIFDKVTSKEYSITYLHGPIIIFGGLVSNFDIVQNNENDLARISLEITKGFTTQGTPAVPLVPNTTGAVPTGVIA